MKEDYVSFETAKLLKEKGFSENTICKYAGVGGITEKWYDDYRERVLRFNWDEGFLIEPPIEPKDQYEIIGDTISAPTLQMVRKWLVQEYRLYVNVVPSVEGYYWTEKWHSYVEDLNKKYPFGRFINTFNSPEEAYEAAIKYCLENLI